MLLHDEVARTLTLLRPPAVSMRHLLSSADPLSARRLAAALGRECGALARSDKTAAAAAPCQRLKNDLANT